MFREKVCKKFENCNPCLLQILLQFAKDMVYKLQISCQIFAEIVEISSWNKMDYYRL